MATVLAAPAVSLDGPTPVAPEYSLLKQLTPVGTSRLAGAALWPYPTSLARLYPHCTTGTFADKDLSEDDPLTPQFSPFTSYLPVHCGTLDATEAELRARALAVFNAVESEAVERELATGEANPDNPYFADADATLLAGAQSPTVALALLERAIATTGRAGIIHADPAVTTAWAMHLQTDGERMVTIANGTQVISGAGYRAIDPDGGALNDPLSEGWAFATGPVVVYRSEAQVLFGFDQSINSQVVLVERAYLATWDTALQTGVLVDFTTTP